MTKEKTRRKPSKGVKITKYKGHKLIDSAEAELYFSEIKKPSYNIFQRKPTVICVSGYFSIIHAGHIRMFKEAKALGDKLVVILNNDEQLFNKKGAVIIPATQRKEVLEAIQYIDEVIIAVDKDNTVCETLRRLQPNVFANGGDRIETNVPEVQVCQNYGIELAWNIGDGGKVDSSSRLIKEIIKGKV